MKDLPISRIIVDVLILVVCALPLGIFHLWVTPYKRGFYCDDESIRYPFRDSTVSTGTLIVIGAIIPTTLIIMTEALRSLAWDRQCDIDPSKQYVCRRVVINRFFVRLYVFIGYYALGACFNQLMIAIAKYSIGRLRPHFIDICRPDNIVLNTTCPSHIYITDYVCTGTDDYYIRDAHLSFFSGHSAFSFYAAWFTALYLQARIYRPLFSRILLPTIQFALFALAAACSYSRISDYKHHWSDVLFGAIVGSVMGIVNAIFFAEVFKRREIPLPPSSTIIVNNSSTSKTDVDIIKQSGRGSDIEIGLIKQQTMAIPPTTLDTSGYQRSAVDDSLNNSTSNDVFYSPTDSPPQHRSSPITMRKHV